MNAIFQLVLRHGYSVLFVKKQIVPALNNGWVSGGFFPALWPVIDLDGGGHGRKKPGEIDNAAR